VCLDARQAQPFGVSESFLPLKRPVFPFIPWRAQKQYCQQVLPKTLWEKPTAELARAKENNASV